MSSRASLGRTKFVNFPFLKKPSLLFPGSVCTSGKNLCPMEKKPLNETLPQAHQLLNSPRQLTRFAGILLKKRNQLCTSLLADSKTNMWPESCVQYDCQAGTEQCVGVPSTGCLLLLACAHQRSMPGSLSPAASTRTHTHISV